MRSDRVLRLALVLVAALWVTISAAVAVPANVWVQFVGYDAVQFDKIANPGYEGGRESEWTYYAQVSLSADYPEILYATGWGSGPFVDGKGKLIPLWIQEIVLNDGQSNEYWNDFHVRVGGEGYTYDLMGNFNSGWDAESSEEMDGWDFYAAPGSEIAPGESFLDGFRFYVIDDDNNGIGDFTVTKWPTVPEPGSLAILASGICAAGAGMIRKKRKM